MHHSSYCKGDSVVRQRVFLSLAQKGDGNGAGKGDEGEGIFAVPEVWNGECDAVWDKERAAAVSVPGMWGDVSRGDSRPDSLSLPVLCRGLCPEWVCRKWA